VDDTIGTGLLFASLFHEDPENYAIISNNLYSAQKTYEFLLNFLNEDQVVFFPADELLRAESLSSSRELMAQRLYAMGQLLKPGKKILVTHPGRPYYVIFLIPKNSKRASSSQKRGQNRP
jgi:transcription-repair coupling factor (superfamily II helicase)